MTTIRLRNVASLVALSFAIGSIGVADDQHGNQQHGNQHDQLKIAAQKICPVSGKPLGSMGTPLKTTIGDEELFLCCQNCTSGQVSREHWATIHSNFAKAQGICPVMKKPIPANAKWTVVNGQIVYVCCPPCIEKINADPAKFVADVDKLYSASLKGSPSL